MLRRQVPLYYAVILVFILLAVGAGLFYKFRENIYNYSIALEGRRTSQGGLDFGPWPELSNPDFFGKVRDEFVSQKASFIEADLSKKILRVYDAGSVVKEVPIVAIGKKGSWWETPAGLYSIESKERNHFSSFGEVYQPWSMVFQGNFFIHGWPYYPDGTPVVSTYSGGCIRLSTKDAETVYGLVNRGMPVLVFAEDFEKDSYVYSPKLPDVTASEYLAADLRNNYVFLNQNEKIRAPIASITKLMTTLVAQEYINLEDKIRITPSMVASTSVPRLSAGENIRALDLLYPLLAESSNEAAFAFESYVGKDRFVDLMNKKAVSLGLSNTIFADAAGVSEDNISTPEDLFQLSKFLYNNRSFVLALTSATSSPAVPKRFRDLRNFNLFPEEPGFRGGKIGKSASAKETMVAVFDLDVNGTNRPIAITVLGSDDAKKDVSAILNYIRNIY